MPWVAFYAPRVYLWLIEAHTEDEALDKLYKHLRTANDDRTATSIIETLRNQEAGCFIKHAPIMR